MKTIIGIPAFNEEKNIGPIVAKLKEKYDYVIVCATEIDAKAFANSLYKEAKRSNELTTKTISKETIRHNCTYGKQTFTYLKGEYVCGFTIIRHNFSILHTNVRDKLKIKEYMIVNARTNTDTYNPCNLRNLHSM